MTDDDARVREGGTAAMNKPVLGVVDGRPTPLRRADLSAGLWSTGMHIRFGHCDPAGIVYTPKFFDIFNVVIEKWYEGALGLDYYEFIGKRRIGLGYVNAHADFFSPCTMGDTLDVAVAVERIGNSSFALRLHAFRDGTEALRGYFTVVTTDLTIHKSMPVPPDLRTALAGYAKS